MPSLRLILIILMLLGAWGAALPCAGQASAQRDFARSWNEFQRLIKDPQQSRERTAWLAVRDMFNSAYQKSPNGPDAPKVLFYLGRVHEEMGVRLKQRSDFSQATDYYGQVASRFPNHAWVDNALLRKARVHREHLEDPAQAYIDLLAIIHNHPKGDMVPQAQAMLRELDALFLAKVNRESGSAQAAIAPELPKGPAPEASGSDQQAAPPPSLSPQVAATDGQSKKSDQQAAPPSLSPPRPAGADTDARLLQIRYWSSDEYTRVVLDVDSEASFSYRLLKPDPALGTPHRLMIDLQGTVLGPNAPTKLHVADGILRQVRSGQNQPQVSRVVLDIQRLEDFRVFTLKEPFRIIVDVSGSKVRTPATASAQQPASPRQVQLPQGRDVAASLVEQLGLKVKTIMIDPGHGGRDPGVVAFGIKEKDIALRMSRILGNMLKEKGFHVLYTRTTDVFIPLEERTAMANAQNADLFLSIHTNAHRNPNVRGFEIYSLNLAKTEDAIRVAARENAVSTRQISDLQFILTDLLLDSKISESHKLATKVHARTIQGMRRTHPHLKDRGVREAPFFVLMGAKMPAVLVELGFLTNREEARLLNTDAYLRALARNIVQGVLAYKDHINRHAKL